MKLISAILWRLLHLMPTLVNLFPNLSVNPRDFPQSEILQINCAQCGFILKRDP